MASLTLRGFLDGELRLRGWSQAELARRSGLSRQHVSKLLNGNGHGGLRRLPSEGTMNALAAGLGIPAQTIRASAAAELAQTPVDANDPETAEVEAPADWRRELAGYSTDTLLAELSRRFKSRA